MILFALSLLWFATMAFILIRAAGQLSGYSQLRASDAAPLPANPPAAVPTVTIIVPARNESANLARSIPGLLAQTYPAARMSLVLIDDHSTDGTGDVARGYAQRDPRMMVVSAPDLPPGWAGKPHACWRGFQSAEPSDWLCFIDADTRSSPELIAAAVHAAESRNVDMLTLNPFQELGTFWERMLIPTGILLLTFCQDLRKVNDPARPEALANGQFILIRRTTYEAVGGHKAVRMQVEEDSALARNVKGQGHRLLVLGADELICTRMYTGLRALWEGLAKNAVDMVGGIGPMMFYTTMAVVLAAATVLLPALTFINLLRSGPSAPNIAATALACVASGAAWGVHVIAARHFRIPLWYGLLFPVGYLVAAALGQSSAMKFRRGKVSWKGRVYDPNAVTPDGEAP